MFEQSTITLMFLKIVSEMFKSYMLKAKTLTWQPQDSQLLFRKIKTKYIEQTNVHL